MSGSLEEARANRRFARKSSGSPLWHFVLGFIKHPMMVGSVIPSSKAMVDKMLAPVDWAKCKLFVEYGPGVGAFTEHVLRRMAPDATLIAIDLNPDFVRYLRGKFTDSRLFPVTGSAADVSQIIADCGFDGNDCSRRAAGCCTRCGVGLASRRAAGVGAAAIDRVARPGPDDAAADRCAAR